MSSRCLGLLTAFALLTACSSESSSDEDTASPGQDTTTQDTATPEDIPSDLAQDVTEDLGPDGWVKGCEGELCVADETHAPDPKELGPYPVGVKTFTFNHQGYNNKWRKITVEVWYPATEAARTMTPESIDLQAYAPDDVKPLFDNTEPSVIPTLSVRDAELRRADGPFPLIIFSHGAFGIRFQNVFYTQYLASHGYIVAAPDHADNTLYDLLRNGGYDGSIVAQSALDRPYDIEHLLDKLIDKNTTKGDFFEASFDPEAIGITGHSFGGMVSFLNPMQDPRFKAAVPMTPATQALIVMGYDLAEFPIPVMIMAGTVDQTLETDVEMAAAYDKLPAPKYYFELLTGGHYTYTDICSLELKRLAEDINFGDAEDALNDGCGENNVSVDIAHPLIRQFAVGFFNYYLRGSQDSAKYFSDEEAAKYSDILLYKSAQ